MKLMVMIILLITAFPVCGQMVVTDSLGNRLNLDAWTLFDGKQQQFHHPNGNYYPDKRIGGICWVYTSRYHFHRFQGLMTLGGLGWGIYDAAQKDYFDDWKSWDNVWNFNVRLVGSWLWGHCLDSSNPNACRIAGVTTGTVWTIAQAHHYCLSWQRGPTWQEAGIILGELITPPLIGWWLDKIRHIPSSKPAYRYKIQCRR